MGETRGSRGENGRYHSNFRLKEREIILRWIRAGASGSVVGLAGAGKSNLIGYLCREQDIEEIEGLDGRSVVLVPVDLNDVPDNHIATFYRMILRSFHEVRWQFGGGLQETLSELYRQHRAVTDPFVLQSVLRELLLHLDDQYMQVVLVLDRFDDFCKLAEQAMANTLKGLRDSFKDTLCFLVGMRQEAAYVSTNDKLGELRELVDAHICWVGPMSENDTRHMLQQQAEQLGRGLEEEQVAELWRLTGGYPALVRVASDWWRLEGYLQEISVWEDILRHMPSLQHRLREIWDGIPPDEQNLLLEIQRIWLQTAVVNMSNEEICQSFAHLKQQQSYLFRTLATKGLCVCQPDQTWHLFSALFADFVAANVERGYEEVCLDEETSEIYQGKRPLSDLSNLERSVLTFFLENPRVKLTKDELIMNAWPKEVVEGENVSDESLYQVISALRRKIEPLRSKKPRYIVTWHGRGYQFFPNGQPNGEG
ncbi:MAG: winged helix-turn-helix domain-containing protein [Anaerolineales bacterium]|nr:winged helix-turn-helix domain-containing protein [Anaerolineales bacterium]